MLRFGANPVVVLLNNGRYVIEEEIHSGQGYNTLQVRGRRGAGSLSAAKGGLSCCRVAVQGMKAAVCLRVAKTLSTNLGRSALQQRLQFPAPQTHHGPSPGTTRALPVRCTTAAAAWPCRSPPRPASCAARWPRRARTPARSRLWSASSAPTTATWSCSSSGRAWPRPTAARLSRPAEAAGAACVRLWAWMLGVGLLVVASCCAAGWAATLSRRRHQLNVA